MQNPLKTIRDFINDSRHIMSVSYKPDIDTFRRTLKIVLLGILVLGILGLIISQIINYID